MFAKFINIHAYLFAKAFHLAERHTFSLLSGTPLRSKKINIIKNFANAAFNKMRNYTKFTSTANRPFTIDIYLS